MILVAYQFSEALDSMARQKEFHNRSSQPHDQAEISTSSHSVLLPTALTAQPMATREAANNLPAFQRPDLDKHARGCGQPHGLTEQRAQPFGMPSTSTLHSARHCKPTPGTRTSTSTHLLEQPSPKLDQKQTLTRGSPTLQLRLKQF